MTNNQQPQWLPSQYPPAFRQNQQQPQKQPFPQDFVLYGPPQQLAPSRANQAYQQLPEYLSSRQYPAHSAVQSQPARNFNIQPQRNQPIPGMDFNELLGYSPDDPLSVLTSFDADVSPLFGADTSFGGAEFSDMPTDPLDGQYQSEFISPEHLSKSSSFCGTGSSSLGHLATPELDFGNYSPDHEIDTLVGASSGRYTGSLFPEAQQPQQSQQSTESTSTGNSATRPSLGHRHSNSAGVNKSTKRRKAAPLKEIIIPEDDKVAAKRARNTQAARESRKRKEETLQTFQDEITAQADEIQRLQGLLTSNGILY